MRHTEKEEDKLRKRGWVFLTLWAILIVAGIVAKRVYGHPDLMVFYHLPAAVCLVIGWFHLSAKVRRRYKEAVARAQMKQMSQFNRGAVLTAKEKLR